MQNRQSYIRSNTGTMKEVKICVLGDISVGKSCLAMRFVNNVFTINPSTIGASFLSKPITVQDQVIKLNIWDTAGSERYRSLAPAYYRGASIAILVYDVTSMDSFLALQWWVDTIQDYGPPDLIFVIAGNKCDLDEREVFANEVELYAESIDAIFIETSAKTGENVGRLFESACMKLLQREDKSSKPAIGKPDHNVVQLPGHPVTRDQEEPPSKKSCSCK